MFCRECGKKISDSSRFCTFCGTKVTTICEQATDKSVSIADGRTEIKMQESQAGEVTFQNTEGKDDLSVKSVKDDDKSSQSEDNNANADATSVSELMPKLEEMRDAAEICDFLCLYTISLKHRKTLMEFKNQEIKFGNRKNQILYTIEHWDDLNEEIDYDPNAGKMYEAELPAPKTPDTVSESVKNEKPSDDSDFMDLSKYSFNNAKQDKTSSSFFETLDMKGKAMVISIPALILVLIVGIMTEFGTAQKISLKKEDIKAIIWILAIVILPVLVWGMKYDSVKKKIKTSLMFGLPIIAWTFGVYKLDLFQFCRFNTFIDWIVDISFIWGPLLFLELYLLVHFVRSRCEKCGLFWALKRIKSVNVSKEASTIKEKRNIYNSKHQVIRTYEVDVPSTKYTDKVYYECKYCGNGTIRYHTYNLKN